MEYKNMHNICPTNLFFLFCFQVCKARKYLLERKWRYFGGILLRKCSVLAREINGARSFKPDVSESQKSNVYFPVCVCPNLWRPLAVPKKFTKNRFIEILSAKHFLRGIPRNPFQQFLCPLHLHDNYMSTANGTMSGRRRRRTKSHIHSLCPSSRWCMHEYERTCTETALNQIVCNWIYSLHFRVSIRYTHIAHIYYMCSLPLRSSASGELFKASSSSLLSNFPSMMNWTHPSLPPLSLLSCLVTTHQNATARSRLSNIFPILLA